ncbi:hypothetical protein VTH06DRAFT_1071 [Thermothelomyces fergusii]
MPGRKPQKGPNTLTYALHDTWSVTWLSIAPHVAGVFSSGNIAPNHDPSDHLLPSLGRGAVLVKQYSPRPVDSTQFLW